MQLVPIIPQPPVGVKETNEVKAVAAVQSAKPAVDTAVTPVAGEYGAMPDKLREHAHRGEQLQVQLVERRRFCRRTQHLPILQELRSSIDRRRRGGVEVQQHIDEEA